MVNFDKAVCLGLSVLFLLPHPNKVWLLEKFIFDLEVFPDNSKINSVLVRQLKSLKKMVVSSVKFTVLILWYPICMLLILVSSSLRIAGTSAKIMRSNTENGQTRRNPRVRLKESDRRSFILILD